MEPRILTPKSTSGPSHPPTGHAGCGQGHPALGFAAISGVSHATATTPRRRDVIAAVPAVPDHRTLHDTTYVDRRRPREETRVVVADGQELQEFDVESSSKSQLKGNIYLAKVTRVEPSLQAAFVDYGGNRHGFLAFSEIHPDYFQIPVSDREALAAEQARLVDEARDADESEADEEAAADDSDDAEDLNDDDSDDADSGDAMTTPTIATTLMMKRSPKPKVTTPATTRTTNRATMIPAPKKRTATKPKRRRTTKAGRNPKRKTETAAARRRRQTNDDDHGDDREQVARREAILKRGYKIQEVIKRRQILLVQVVKEERGNKGAAPDDLHVDRRTLLRLDAEHTARGGISRKIADPQQRRRLKAIAQDLNVPEGTGLIIRTAGMAARRPRSNATSPAS